MFILLGIALTALAGWAGFRTGRKYEEWPDAERLWRDLDATAWKAEQWRREALRWKMRALRLGWKPRKSL